MSYPIYLKDKLTGIMINEGLEVEWSISWLYYLAIKKYFPYF